MNKIQLNSDYVNNLYDYLMDGSEGRRSTHKLRVTRELKDISYMCDSLRDSYNRHGDIAWHLGDRYSRKDIGRLEEVRIYVSNLRLYLDDNSLSLEEAMVEDIPKGDMLDGIQFHRDEYVTEKEDLLGKSIGFDIKSLDDINLESTETEEEEEEEDLFEDHENLPLKMQLLMQQHFEDVEESNMDKYEAANKFLKEAKKLGYTFEYGLDGDPYGLKKIK